jgi:hypothetical protein
MNSGDASSVAFNNQKRHPYGNNTLSIFVWLLSLLSLPIELFFRRRFGVRYVDYPLLVAMLLFINSLGTVTWTVKVLGGHGAYPIIGYAFSFLAFALGLFYRVQGGLRERRGELWHSYSPGISHLERWLPIPSTLVQRFLEPGLAILLGLLLRDSLSSYLGTIVLMGGWALFLKEFIRHTVQRNRYLDVVDAQIEGQVMQTLLQQGWFEQPSSNRQHQGQGGYHVYIPPLPKDKGQIILEQLSTPTEEAPPANTSSDWQAFKARQKEANS